MQKRTHVNSPHNFARILSLSPDGAVTKDSCPGESQQQIIAPFFMHKREGKERTENKYEIFKRGMNIERKN